MKDRLSALTRILLTPFAVILMVFAAAGAVTRRLGNDLSADEVVNYLRDFIEGTGGEWDWDDFTSEPIKNPRLESIRIRASAISLPVNDKGRRKLQGLLQEAERLAREQI